MEMYYLNYHATGQTHVEYDEVVYDTSFNGMLELDIDLKLFNEDDLASLSSSNAIYNVSHYSSDYDFKIEVYIPKNSKVNLLSWYGNAYSVIKGSLLKIKRHETIKSIMSV